MSVASVVLLGLGAKDFVVTLGYGSGAAAAPVVEDVRREHWGHWPLVRRKLSSSSTTYTEEAEEEIIEEIEKDLEQAEITFKALPADWNKVLDDALEKVQQKLKAETFVDLAARKEERRREKAQREEKALRAKALLEEAAAREEESLMVFLLSEDY